MTDADTPSVRLVKGIYAAFGAGDMDAVVDAMHPDMEWHEAEHSPWHTPEGYHGPADVVANMFARIGIDFDEFEVVPRTFHDAGTTVIVEGRYRGRASTTSDQLDAQACHVWTVRDGKLARFQQYTDTWQFARVTGTPTT